MAATVTRDHLAVICGALVIGGALGVWAGRQAGDAQAARWARQRDSLAVAFAAREGGLRMAADSARRALERLSVPTPAPARPPRVIVDTVTVPAFVDSESVHAWRRYAADQRRLVDEAEDARAEAYAYGEAEGRRADSAVAVGQRLTGILAVRDSQIVALQRLTSRAPIRRRMAGGLAVEALADLGGGLEVAVTAALPVTGRVALLARASAGPEGQTVRAGLRVGF